MRLDYYAALKKTLSLLPLLAAMLTAASGCSSITDRSTRESPTIPQVLSEPTSEPITNLDALETDPAYLGDLPPEQRAVEISRLWFEHANRLEQSSYTGAFAAFSRSAHIALHNLVSEACRTPFHPPCRDLDQAYKRSVEGLARILARNSWTPPDLGRTRYHLTPASIAAISSLREWRISLDHPSHEQLATRPGLGLASVGCRRVRGVDTVCTPLTFAITFAGTPDSPDTEASFNAFDAFQQEILTLGSQHVPLAAAFEQTVLTLGALAGNSSQPGLYCLSMPTSSTPTTVILTETTAAATTARNILVPLVRDSAVINASSLCLQTVASVEGSPASLARTVLTSLRAAYSVVGAETLRLGVRQPLTIIAMGDQAAEVALAIAQRTSRLRRPQTKRNEPGIRFAPQGLVTILTSSGATPLVERTDLPIKSYTAPCSHECLAGIKETLVNTPVAPSSRAIPQENRETLQDGYELSPVI